MVGEKRGTVDSVRYGTVRLGYFLTLVPTDGYFGLYI